MTDLETKLNEAADKEYPTYFYRSPIDENLAQRNAFKRDAFKAGHKWTIEYLARHQNESALKLQVEQYKKEIDKLEAEILELKSKFKMPRIFEGKFTKCGHPATDGNFYIRDYDDYKMCKTCLYDRNKKYKSVKKERAKDQGSMA